jgi:tripartite-type tricarboxylate transporter receptor subunit TctC
MLPIYGIDLTHASPAINIVPRLNRAAEAAFDRREIRMKSLHVWLLSAIAGSLFALAAPQAFGQGDTYPSRPIRMVVGYPPGGSTDVAARLVAEQLSRALGQSVVVENKPGASGTIGAAFVSRSEPDGYTLLFGSSTDVAKARATIKDVPYDTLKDLQPITLVGTVPFLLVTHSSLPANNLSELIAWIKANPGKVNYSSFGRGTSNHFAGEAFKLAAGVQAQDIPYKGSAPSLQALMGGQVQFTFDTVVAALPHVRAGTFKAVAITADKRSALVPEVPTMSEAGVAGFIAGTWWGMLAPKQTPKPVIDRLHGAIVGILAMPDVQKRFVELGGQLVGNSPAEFARFIDSEARQSISLAAQIGLKPE